MIALRRYRRALLVLAAALLAGAVAWLVSVPAGAALGVVLLMPMIPLAALRFLASIFLLIAIVALVADMTPAVNESSGLAATSFAEHWARLAPVSFNAAKDAIAARGGAWLWEGPVAAVLGFPTFVLFGLMAFACGYAGRRRREIDIFVN